MYDRRQYVWGREWQKTVCMRTHECMCDRRQCVCMYRRVHQKTVCVCVCTWQKVCVCACVCIWVRVWQNTTCKSLLPSSSIWDQRIKFGWSSWQWGPSLGRYSYSPIVLCQSRMMAHTCTLEAKAGGSAQTQGQPGLQNEASNHRYTDGYIERSTVLNLSQRS